MQNVQTGERTGLTRKVYDEILGRRTEAGEEVEEVKDDAGNRTMMLRNEDYLHEQHRLHARARQLAKARQKRRQKSKTGAASRARNRSN